MAFELIPFPISIIFVLVFALVFMAVLWKLRKRGKAYNILFKIAAIVGVLLLIAFLFSIIH